MEGLANTAVKQLFEYGVLGLVFVIALGAIVYLVRDRAKREQSHLDDVKTSAGVISSLDLQMKVVDLNMRNLSDDIRDLKDMVRDLGRKS